MAFSNSNYRNKRDEEDRYWRRREEEQRRQQEAEKKRKEEEIRKATDIKSEEAFPSLGGPRPKATGLGKNSFAVLSNEPKSNTFARLATEWKKEEETAKEKERLERIRLQKQQQRVSSEGIFIYRPRQARFEEPDDEEEVPGPRPLRVTDDWNEVSHSRYKAKRDMTVEEMDEMCQDMEDDEDEYGRGLNEHLFEVSHRHDHH